MRIDQFLKSENKDKISPKKVINQTESICPECMQRIPAEVVTDGKAVYLQKVCPEHGPSEGLVWSDLELYQKACKEGSPNAKPEPVSPGNPFYYGLCNQVAKRSCLAILEITHHCNTNCPICIAKTPHQKGKPPLTLKQIERAVEVFQDTVGTKVPIQLSGGEPTLHEEILKIVEMIKNRGFESLAMDSNGLLLARRPYLARALKESGMDGVFLQFDGISSPVYEKIRGRNLLDEKIRAIESCQKAGLSIIIQPTVVKGVNLDELWDIVQFAVNAGTAGIDFLPFTPTGRYPSWGEDPISRTTISDVIKGIEEQSAGELKAADFYSVPCQDQRCAVISYLLIREGKLLPLTRIVDYSKVKSHYGNLSNWDTILKDPELNLDSQSCTCSSPCCCKSPFYNLKAEGYFIIGCHSFQDRWNFDLERARLCCFHELTSEGRLVPFCYYNIVRK